MRPGAALPSVDPMATDQVWTLTREGREHRVVASTSAAHRVHWYVDGELRAEKKTWDDKVTVAATDGAGKLLVRYSGLGAPRRATLYGPDDEAAALTGLGGVDLVPEPGSKAAAYERRVLDHPTRFALIATAGGVAKVVVPILFALVAVRLAIHLPWPHLPRIPGPDLPDLPRVPWPSIPLPDLPDVHPPDWLLWLLDKVKYVWPIVLAYVLARAEIKRRREQERRRAEQVAADNESE
jgi:hypothetical protein